MGMNTLQIKKRLCSDVDITESREDLIPVVEEIVEDVIERHPDYNAIQKIMRSKLILDKDTDEVRIVDFRNKDYQSITKQNLKDMLNSKLDLSNRKYHCEYMYDPFSCEVLTKNSSGFYKYNTYQPPLWYRDYYYSGGTVPVKKREVIPEEYHKFLTHLVGNDAPSYNYILDWMANAIRSRNYCILATIGNQGVGKGVLGEIMRKLFGEENSYVGTDRMIKSNFNPQMLNKKFVYIDEVAIRNKQDEDRIKVVVNDYIEIEKKGIDAQQTKNYANFYISSNNLDALRISADDRRFSIVNLTDTKMRDSWSAAKIQDLLEVELVAELGRYLYYRPTDDQKMLQNFISDRTQEVRDSSMSDWQDWFLGEFCVERAGEQVPTIEVSDEIENKFGRKVRPSRKSLQDLTRISPGKFEVKKVSKNNKQQWVVDFPPLQGGDIDKIKDGLKSGF
jgi:hypothetical protein